MMKKEGRDDSLALVMLFNHKSTSFSFWKASWPFVARKSSAVL
jgi:hypothetical protein